MKNLLPIAMMVWGIFVSAQTPVLYLKYDEASGTQTALDEAGGQSFLITNNFDKPERVPGVNGNALRTDGFSTWASRAFTTNFSTSMTVETWISLESYPSDDEVPYANLTPSAIISQFSGNSGFQIGINTFGDWWFSANVNGTKYTCTASDPFPLYEWVHVAGVIDGTNSIMRLYLNGQQVASVAVPSNGQLNEASVPLYIGKSNVDKTIGIFLVNALSAAYDETKIYSSVLSGTTLLSEYQAGIAAVPTTGFQAIAVPDDRFDQDIQRPRYHAMPPANWTNEPHGMVEYNGQYHLFYQRTPNGPFKFQMHWGHMVSPDLVNWTDLKDALWPSLEWSSTSGYDMKGIWSGDVVVENGTAHAFYTNVNHTGPYNPGIAHATSTDGSIENWTKQGPVIDKQYVNDFRDPYLWKDGTTWHMIIGAAVGSTGGLDYYTSTNLTSWTHQSQFSTVAYSSMDNGSAIWEMPVFESLGNGKYILIANPIGGSRAKYGPDYTRGVYWIGTWANGQFTPDYNQPKNLDVIHGHLSPTVARNTSGQLVGIGIVDERWGSQAQLDAGWCHTFSLPRVYSLLSDNATLGQSPAPELQSLRIAGSQLSTSNLSVNGDTPISSRGQTVEIIAQVNPNTTASKYGINFYVSDNREEITRLYYDQVNDKIVLDKTNSSLSSQDEEATLISGSYDEAAFGKPQKFHVFLDHSAIDVFINDKAAFSNRLYPTLTGSERIELYSEGATTTFTSVETWALGRNGTGVPVTGLALNKFSILLPLSKTAQLTATVSPANATIKTLTWASSNEAVATVSANGVVSPVALGTATITVTSVSSGLSINCTVSVIPTPTYTVYDFESGDLTGWTVSGSAFSVQDISTDTSWWGGDFGHHGTYHLWGHKDGGDTQIGSIKTSNFTLGGDGQVDLLIGGGNDMQTMYVALVRASDNKRLVRVTGDNWDAYEAKTLDGSAYTGTTCYLMAVDSSTGGWGHVNLDYVRIPVQGGSPVPVTGVTVSPPSVSLTVNQTADLTETVSPSNATNQSVTWSSSNTAVATVNSSGLVTAVGAGTATITVTTQDGGFTAQSSITVPNQTYLVYDFEGGNLNGWTVTGESFSLSDVTSDVNWGWGGPFNHQGSYHLWGVKSGTDSQTGSLKSQDFVLGGNGIITFLIGGGFDLNTIYIALVRKSDGVELMKSTGDNNDSEAYAQKQFDASAYIGTECFLKVVDNATGGWGHINLDNIRIPYTNIAVTGVSLNSSSLTITEGSLETLIATVSPSNASNKSVCWSSSNTTIVMVDQGIVTGIAPGTATITAKTLDGGFIASASVTVQSQQYMTYDFESGNLNGWTITGAAFSVSDVTSDTNWGWGGPFNHEGSYHLWSVKSGTDSQTGSLRSQDFVLDGNGIITFLIGGGFDINTVYMALVRKSDGIELMKATGDNNDSEAYAQRQFNAGAYVGVECYLKVVDNATGGWGHINLDDIVIPISSVAVTGVVLNSSSMTLVTGTTATLDATILPVGATNQNRTWSSSNASVASVSSTGAVTAVAPGTATITVTTQDGSYTDNATITVQNQQYLVYDFEAANLSGWTTTGTAFVTSDVTSDVNWGWGGPFNQQGNYHLWGVKSGSDTDTGTMQSQTFTLGGNGTITFLIGGGFTSSTLYLGLYRASDHTLLMQATGDNNDSEAYAQKQFNASAYIGQSLYLKAVDNATGGWGHINLDNIRIPIASSSSRLSTTPDYQDSQPGVTKVELYPVPTSEFLSVELPEEVKYASFRLFTLDGRLVLSESLGATTNRIKVSGIKKGMFVSVIVLDNGRIEKFKIILE